MNGKRNGLCLLSFLLAFSICTAQAAKPQTGYQAEVFVEQSGNIDSVFPLANQSPAQLPADWNPNYEADQQRFELFVPAEVTSHNQVKNSDKDAAKGYPLILFISPGKNPQGWPQFEKVCKTHGVIYASPFEAGNNCPAPRRVRIVLDALNQLRKTYPIDPNRTYLAGFSGGGRVALMIAYALPEYFGGVIPVCAAESPREESWLRERITSRLSIALVTGEKDFNRGEVERWKGPLLAEVGIRSKIWVAPKLGHGIPGNETLEEVFIWLESGLAERRRLSRQWPASSADMMEVFERSEQATALFAEAKDRLAKPNSFYSGLMQLKGISTRWPDLPEAKSATKLLLEYDSQEKRPWEVEDLAEQRKYLIAEARGLTAYATGPLPAQYAALQPRMAEAAINMWEQILSDGQDAKAVVEAKRRIPGLKALLPDKK